MFEDEAALKEQTVEVMTAVGTFMREALPVVQAVPELSPLAFEMLEMGVRQLKRGRALEDVIEQVKQAVLQKVAQAQQQAQQLQAPPAPDPKAVAEQARASTIQAKAQAEAAIGAQEMQVRQQELALRVQELELKQRELQTKLQAAQEQAARQQMDLLGAQAMHADNPGRLPQ